MAPSAIEPLSETPRAPKMAISSEQSLLFASRRVIAHLGQPLIAQMGIHEGASEPLHFLDLACGTGILTDLVQDRVPLGVLQKSTFLATDASEHMVGVATKRIKLEGWINTRTEVMDAKSTKLPDASFTHVGVALALHAIPDPDAVVKEAMRILRPGGVFGATTFAAENSTQWFVRDLDTAFAALPIETPPLAPMAMQLHDYGNWTDAAWVESQLKGLGLKNVEVETTPGTWWCESAEEWMRIFEGMMVWLMNTKWDAETRAKMPAQEVRKRVVKHLREKYNGQGWEVSWTTIVMTGRTRRSD